MGALLDAFRMISLAPGWVELPAEYAESLMGKALSHKYIKRVPTGKVTKTGKPRYRYFYHVGHGGGVHAEDHFVEGASFRHKDGYAKIAKVDGDQVTVEHASGETKSMSKRELRSMLAEHHAEALAEHQERAKAALADAKANKASEKQFARIEARIKASAPDVVERAQKRDADQAKADFGLRGFEYGAIQGPSDREYHAEKFHAAASDLARVTGLTPKQIGLNGKLRVVMGMKGPRNAKAFYAPETHDLVFTEKQSEGTFAHEWAHAFDNIIAKTALEAAGKKTLGKPPWLSQSGMYSSGQADHFPKEVNDAIKGVMGAILKRPGDPVELVRKHKQEREELKAAYAQAREDNIKFSAQSKEATDHASATDLRWKAFDAKRRADEIGNAYDALGTDPLASSFANLSTKAGKYWADPVEMFARAFEAHVASKLASEGKPNPYLVDQSKTVSDVYPKGEELERIGVAFDKLMAAVKSSDQLRKGLDATDPLAL
jgi:hypothetical protein